MMLPDRLPEDATPEQHMDRWANHVAINPSACQFDAQRFLADMVARGIIPTFARWVLGCRQAAGRASGRAGRQARREKAG